MVKKNFKFSTNYTITFNIPNCISSILKNLSQMINMHAAVFWWTKYTHIYWILKARGEGQLQPQGIAVLYFLKFFPICCVYLSPPAITFQIQKQNSQLDSSSHFATCSHILWTKTSGSFIDGHNQKVWILQLHNWGGIFMKIRTQVLIR